MALNNPFAAYQTTRTVTASQTKLLVMLHDGAIRFLAQAATAIAQKDFEKKALNFGKANAIIEHLWGTLDHEKGGDIAENLEKLFSYMHTRLLTANLKDDVSAIKEVMTHLRELREAWAQVDMEMTAQNAPAEQRQESADGKELQFAA